jgi:aminoglycoside phosphotransferase (APT) family kinase protein
MTRHKHKLLAEQLARRIFPQAQTLVVSKMRSGASTWVYRIKRDGVDFYLRILPEENASFAPEVYVHSMLAARTLHVPEIVYFEHYNDAFQRSIVVTTAIAGTRISTRASTRAMEPVLRQAGRELALLNQTPVDGFGWVQRTAPHVDGLAADYTDYVEWMGAETDQALTVLIEQALLSSPEIMQLERQLAQALQRFSGESSRLAHGDFDPTHIFHCGREYTGMIDFGEIRGSHYLYDLGHFAIEYAHFLPALLAGYATITPLPADHELQILQTSLLIAVNRMGRRAARQASILAVDQQLVARALNALASA